MDTVNKEFLTIKFKRMQDARSNYVEVKGWKVQQIVFVGGTCGSVHVGSFNENMKALGVLESKRDPISQNLVRHLLEEQDKVLLCTKGGGRSKGSRQGSGTCQVGHVCVKGIDWGLREGLEN